MHAPYSMPYRNFFWLLWITKKLLLLLLLLPVRAVDHGDARAAPANGVLIDVVRTVAGQERVLLGVGQPLTARLWGNPILGTLWFIVCFPGAPNFRRQGRVTPGFEQDRFWHFLRDGRIGRGWAELRLLAHGGRAVCWLERRTARPPKGGTVGAVGRGHNSAASFGS